MAVAVHPPACPALSTAPCPPLFSRSGFAYVISRPGERAPGVMLHQDWPDRAAAAGDGGGAGGGAGRAAAAGGAAGGGDRYPKTRTALLLRGGRGVAFGWTAVRMYCEMDENERADGRSAYGEKRFSIPLSVAGLEGIRLVNHDKLALIAVLSAYVF
jgi:hypothetical protein